MARAGVRDVRFRVRPLWARLSLGIGAVLGGLLLLWGYPRAQALLVRSLSLRAEDAEGVLASLPVSPSSVRVGLGLRYLYDPLTFDPRRALMHLQRALRENPFDFRNWVHLGQGYEAAGDRVRAEAAYRQALASAPAYFLPRWLYANFLLKQGDSDRALDVFADAARANPEALANIAELLQDAERWERLGRRISDAHVRARLCAVLLSRGALRSASALWRDLPWSEELKVELARRAISRGISTGEYALAHALWDDLRQHIYGRGEPSEEFVWNGGFELVPLSEAIAHRPLPAFGLDEESAVPERGFDWQIQSDEQVVAGIVRDVSYEGERALQLEFVRHEAVRFSGVSQFVLLRPATAYELRFAYRADVRGDPRVSVDVVEARRGVPQEDAVLFRWMAPPGAGRTEWTLVRGTFEVSSEAPLVLLRLRREPAPSLADFVKGRVWFDAFSIRPIQRRALVAEGEEKP